MVKIIQNELMIHKIIQLGWWQTIYLLILFLYPLKWASQPFPSSSHKLGPKFVSTSSIVIISLTNARFCDFPFLRWEQTNIDEASCIHFDPELLRYKDFKAGWTDFFFCISWIDHIELGSGRSTIFLYSISHSTFKLYWWFKRKITLKG